MAKTRFSTSSLLWIAAVLQIVWGMVPSASKLVIDEIPVELYIALRWTISGAIFLGVLLYQRRWPRLFRRETALTALLGIAGYALASIGTLHGLKIGGVTNFALMGSLNPMITSAVAILFLKERPARLFYIALPFCVGGLLLLVTGKQSLSSWQVALSSSSLIIGAAILEALVFVASKNMKEHFSTLQYLAIAQLSAATVMWLAQASVFQQGPSLLNLSLQGWSAAIFVSVVACVLCYAILYWLLNFIDGHRLALFDGLHALSATLLGYILFHEPLNAPMALGGALLLAGLVLGNLRTARTDISDRSEAPTELTPSRNPS